MALVVQSTGTALHFNGLAPLEASELTANINVDVYWHKLSEAYQSAKLLGTFRVGAKVNFAVPVSEPTWVALRYVTRGGRGETDVGDIRDAPTAIILAPGFGGGGGGATRRDVRSHILNPVEDLAYLIPRDGSVDVGAKIQLAINQAIAEKRELYFPPGRYKFAETLKLGANFVDFKLTGAGRNLTFFEYTGTQNGIEAQDEAVGYNTLFEKFCLEASNPNNYGSGIYFGHANVAFTGAQVLHVAVWNWRRFGFFASNMQSSTLRYCHFRNNRFAHVGLLDPSRGESVMEPNVNLLADSLLDNTVITGAGYQTEVASFSGLTEGRTGGLLITGGWSPSAADFGRVVILLNEIGDGGGQYYGVDRHNYGVIHDVSGNRLETSAPGVGGDTPINAPPDGINATQTTIPIHFDGFIFEQTVPGKARIENEIINYSGYSFNLLTGVTRGADGTTAAPHADLTHIRQLRPVTGKVMPESYAGVWARNANLFSMVNNTIQGNFQNNTAGRICYAVYLASLYGFVGKNNWIENVPIDGSGQPQPGAGWRLERVRGSTFEASGSSANHWADVEIVDSHALKFTGGFWGQTHHHFATDINSDSISVDDAVLAAPQFVYGRDRTIDRIRVGPSVRYFYGSVSHFDYSATTLLPDELEDNLLSNGRFLFPVGGAGNWIDNGTGGWSVVLAAGADGTKKYDNYLRINNRGGSVNEATGLISQASLFPAREAQEFVTLRFDYFIEDLGAAAQPVVVALEGSTAGGTYAGADASLRIENDGSLEAGVWRAASLTVKLAAAGSDRQLFTAFRSSNLSGASVVRFANLKLVRGRHSTGQWRTPITSEAGGTIIAPSGLTLKSQASPAVAPAGCASLAYNGTEWVASSNGAAYAPISSAGSWTDDSAAGKTTTTRSVEPRPTSTANVPLRVVGPAGLATNVFEAWKGPPTGEPGGSAANRVYAVTNSGVMFLNQGNVRQNARVKDISDGEQLTAEDAYVIVRSAAAGPRTLYLPPTNNRGMRLVIMCEGSYSILVTSWPGERWDGVTNTGPSPARTEKTINPGAGLGAGLLELVCVSDPLVPAYVAQWRTITYVAG